MASRTRAKHEARRLLDTAAAAARNLRVLPSIPYPDQRVTLEDVRQRPAAFRSEVCDIFAAGKPPSGVANSVTAFPAGAFRPLAEQFVSVPGVVLRSRGGCLMGPDGAVVTPSGEVISDTLWTPELFEAGFPKRRCIRPPRRVAGSHASLVAPWSSNWGHWLINTLPRLRTLELAGLSRIPIIVPRRLPPAKRASLEMLGISEDRRTDYPREGLKPDELIWPSSGTHAYYPTSEALNWLRDRILGALGIESHPHRRLYISRSSSTTQRLPRGYPRRAVTNEDEVVDLLAGFGFETVRPEALTFADQVRLFANARVVVAPHGSGSANCLFSQSTTLVEFFEPRFTDPSSYALAAACGHEYWYLMGATADRGDIAVPVDALRETLRQLGI